MTKKTHNNMKCTSRFPCSCKNTTKITSVQDMTEKNVVFNFLSSNTSCSYFIINHKFMDHHSFRLTGLSFWFISTKIVHMECNQMKRHIRNQHVQIICNLMSLSSYKKTRNGCISCTIKLLYLVKEIGRSQIRTKQDQYKDHSSSLNHFPNHCTIIFYTISRWFIKIYVP